MEDRLLEYLDGAESVVDQYGSSAVDGLMMWASFDAASGLIIAAVFFIASAIASALWTRQIWDSAKDYQGETGESYFGVALFLQACVSLPGAIALIGLMNVYRWIGVFNPEFWLIHKAISAIS